MQLVEKPTRRQKILDVFLTNCPHPCKQPIIFKGIVRSVLITPQHAARPERKYVYFRDVRDHRKSNMGKKLETCDWSGVYTCDDSSITVGLLNDIITGKFNESFLLIMVKVSTRDPPHMSSLVKHLCTIRNENRLIGENQVRAAYDENKKYSAASKGWWNTVNKITGRGNYWYFQNINTDTQYTAPNILPIPAGTRIPTVDVHTVRTFLTEQKRISPGPDGLPYWMRKDFTITQQLAPVVTYVFNLSLKQ